MMELNLVSASRNERSSGSVSEVAETNGEDGSITLNTTTQ